MATVNNTTLMNFSSGFVSSTSIPKKNIKNYSVIITGRPRFLAIGPGFRFDTFAIRTVDEPVYATIIYKKTRKYPKQTPCVLPEGSWEVTFSQDGCFVSVKRDYSKSHWLVKFKH